MEQEKDLSQEFKLDDTRNYIYMYTYSFLPIYPAYLLDPSAQGKI